MDRHSDECENGIEVLRLAAVACTRRRSPDEDPTTAWASDRITCTLSVTKELGWKEHIAGRAGRADKIDDPRSCRQFLSQSFVNRKELARE